MERKMRRMGFEKNLERWDVSKNKKDGM